MNRQAHHREEYHRVRFESGTDQVYSIEKYPVECRSVLWYNRQELWKCLEQDGDTRNMLLQRKTEQTFDNDNVFTMRGLELDHDTLGIQLATIAGGVGGEDEIDDEKCRSIKSYMQDVIGVYRYGMAEYGQADPEMLRSFAVSRSSQDRQHAQELGLQNERECLA